MSVFAQSVNDETGIQTGFSCQEGAVSPELVSSIRESTAKFLKSFNIDGVNLGYINENRINAALNAVPITTEAIQESTYLADAETKARVPGESLLAGQWSGYIYDITYYDDGTMGFFTSCGVTGTQEYTINRSQVVSLKQTGLCYQYSLFYLVYNE